MTAPKSPAATTRLTGPGHTVRTLAAMTRAELAANAAYRAQVILGAFAWILPLVMMVLWRAVAVGPDQEAQVTTYYLAVLLTTVLDPFQMVPWGFSALVRNGRLGAVLLRPIHPMWALVARNIAQIALSLVAAVVMIALVAIFIPTTFSADPLAWLTAVAAFGVGIAGLGLITTMVSAIAFWTTSADGLQSLYLAALGLLGGLFAPFSLLGSGVARWVICQPFWLAVGAPGELVSGLRSPGEMVLPLAAGVLWMIVLVPVSRWVWRRGLSASETVGG